MVVTIITETRARPGKAEALCAALCALAERKRQEPACRSYVLNRDLQDGALFASAESWESLADWEAHLAQAYVADHMQATEGAVEAFSVRQMAPIG